MGLVSQDDIIPQHDTVKEMKDFLQARYKGLSPVLWGSTLREMELTRGIYESVFNLNGAMSDEKK